MALYQPQSSALAGEKMGGTTVCVIVIAIKPGILDTADEKKR